MKKFFGILIATLMLFSFTGCGGSGKNSSRKGSISVLIYEAGFGTQWLENMANEYEKETGVKVKVMPSYVGGEIIGMLDSGTLNADIIMPLGGLSKQSEQGKIIELSDVYNAVPKGETIAIKDKMNQNIYQKNLTKDNKIYTMNWLDTVSTLIYNKTVLDNLFGDDKYILPRTTKELIKFAEEIKTKSNDNVYPFAYSTGGSVGYLRYAHMTWWAQYEGLNNYSDYYYGYYWEGSERKKAESFDDLDAPGRLKSLETASTLWSKSSGYSHQYCDAMTFTEAQAAFLGQGYKGQDMKEVAMMMNGDWLQNEMAVYLANKWQDIRLMRLPVISDIVEKLPTVEDDSELSALIAAIDEKSTALKGDGYDVSQKDFDRVKESRMMVASQTFDHTIAISANSQKQDMAKDFLVFMASDKGQQIYAKQLNGLTQAYGYHPDASEVNDYARSRIDLYGSEYIPICRDLAAPMVYLGGFVEYTNLMSIDGLIFSDRSPKTILAATNSAMKANWKEITKYID